MNSRERIQLALDHKEADRIPFDLGATALTGIHDIAYQNLRRELGLPDRESVIWDARQQIVVLDEDVRSLFPADARPAKPEAEASENATIQTDDTGGRHFYDEWGIGWRKPPQDGFYYDMFHHPLQGEITLDDVRRYPFPDPVRAERFIGMQENARHVGHDLKLAVTLEGFCSGILEMTMWMRGYVDALTDLATGADAFLYLLDSVLELKMQYWEKALATVGADVDVVLEADDMAGQNSTIFSPNTYRRYIKPRHQKLFDFIHQRTRAKIFFHSCGAVRKIIPDLIEAGVDILNPVQVSAADMDSAQLKRDFGSQLTFWGGGVDTQGAFGQSSAQSAEVEADVCKRIEDLAPGGGFVFATVHNIQANVHPQNILAMWQAYRANCQYRQGKD